LCVKHFRNWPFAQRSTITHWTLFNFRLGFYIRQCVIEKIEKLDTSFVLIATSSQCVLLADRRPQQHCLMCRPIVLLKAVHRPTRNFWGKSIHWPTRSAFNLAVNVGLNTCLGLLKKCGDEGLPWCLFNQGVYRHTGPGHHNGGLQSPDSNMLSARTTVLAGYSTRRVSKIATGSAHRP